MNKSEFEDGFYMITFDLKTNIIVPNKNSIPVAIADGLNALYQIIDSNSVDVKSMVINTVNETYEDKVNYVAIDDETEQIEEEKERGFIA